PARQGGLRHVVIAIGRLSYGIPVLAEWGKPRLVFARLVDKCRRADVCPVRTPFPGKGDSAMRQLRSKARFAAIGVSAAALAVTAVSLATPATAAEGTVLGADSPAAVAGSYLVTLKDSVAAQGVSALAGNYGGQVTRTFSSAL